MPTILSRLLSVAFCATSIALTQVDASSLGTRAAPATCTVPGYACSAKPLPNTNCATCKTATTCQTCKPGFALDKTTGACLSCRSNCADAVCTDPMVCKKCKPGFVRAITYDWTDSGLVSEEEGDCQQKRDFCFDCTKGNCAPGHCKNASGAFRGGCDKCPAGSVPVHPVEREVGDKPYWCSVKGCTNCDKYCYDASQPTCYQCPSGYGFKDTNGIRNGCQKCTVKNCESCEANQAGKCTRCAADFYLKNNVCVANTQCPDFPNCNSCDATYCSECKPGFSSGSNGQCVANAQCAVKNCNDCIFGDGTASDPDKCFTCAAGYYGADRGVGAGYLKCIPCPKGDCSNTCTGGCNSGYFCDDNSGLCKPNSQCGVKNCADCLPGSGTKEDPDKCFTCADGYAGYNQGVGAGYLECRKAK